MVGFVGEIHSDQILDDNQMRSSSLLSGPKIHKAYFEASNIKMLHQWPFDPMTLWGNIFGF